METITYVRGSDGGFSTKEQEKIVRKYCSKRRYKIVKAFKDENVSANNFNRPALQEMLEYMRAGKVKVEFLVVTGIDRLTRNVGKFISLKKFFDERGITLVSVSESILKSGGKQAK